MGQGPRRAVPAPRPLRRPGPFSSLDQLLEAAQEMLRIRNQAAEFVDMNAVLSARRWSNSAAAWKRYFYASLAATPQDVVLAPGLKLDGLEQPECELLLALLLMHFGLLARHVHNYGDLLQALRLTPSERLAAMRSLRPGGRLYESGLLAPLADELNLDDRPPMLDPKLIEAVLGPTNEPTDPDITEAQVLEWLAPLTLALARRAVAFGMLRCGHGSDQDLWRADRAVYRLRRPVRRFLKNHPDWGLSRLLAAGDDDGGRSQDMLLALVGRELHHLGHKHDLFTGEGLANAASPTVGAFETTLGLISSNGMLVQRRLARPTGGAGLLLSDDAESIRETPFELGERALELLGRPVTRQRCLGSQLREPQIRFEQLVLSPAVWQALQMAIAHARRGTRLMEDWGLGVVMPYGRGVTLMFAGPPGVGKTAAAEALAAELGSPLLVVNYAEVEDCWLGNTEKKIVQTFRTAAREQAVLLWDEADAMYYDRASAERTWEARHVNVLLQEIERFAGVCILTTNRRTALDPALERRITIKVPFERPDQAMRCEIWRRMLPAQLPVAAEVTHEALSIHDLTGGEIKNVVLNAARMALLRSPDGPVTLADIEAAAAAERLVSRGAGRRIGFQSQQRRTLDGD